MGFVASFGRMTINKAIGYWIAQFAGGIAGLTGLWAIFSSSPACSTSTVGLAQQVGQGLSQSHRPRRCCVEVVITFIFVLVVLTATEQRSARRGSQGWRSAWR